MQYFGVMTHVESQEQQTDPASDAENGTDKQELKREVFDFIKLVVWFLIIFLGLRQYVIEGYEVQGESMEPALSDNQRILVFKLPHELSRFSLFSGMRALEPGDIVVFDSPDSSGKRYVKRIIAMGPKDRGRRTVGAQSEDAETSPSQQVLVTYEDGEVYVNNHKLEEKYLGSRSRRPDESQRLLLNAGEYYVLGDNRAVSKDSRSFKAISDGAIIGKAVIRFWPPSQISLLR